MPIVYQEQVVGMLAGVIDEQALVSLLTSEVYNREGYSFVTDSTGEIIIGSNHQARIFAQDNNMLTMLSSAKLLNNNSYDKVYNNIKAGQSGLVSYTVGDDERYAIYRPVGVNDWFIFNVIPGSIITNMTTSTTRTTYTIILIFQSPS